MWFSKESQCSWEKWSWPHLRYHPRISLDWRKPQKTSKLNSWWPNCDYKWAVLKSKSQVWTNLPSISVSKKRQWTIMQVELRKTSQEGELFPLLLSHYKTQEQKGMKQVLELIYCICLMKEIILYQLTNSLCSFITFSLYTNWYTWMTKVMSKSTTFTYV